MQKLCIAVPKFSFIIAFAWQCQNNVNVKSGYAFIIDLSELLHLGST